MLQDLGISGGTAIVCLIVLYFIIKWAVRNGIKEAYGEITGKEIEDNDLYDDADETLEDEDAEKSN